MGKARTEVGNRRKKEKQKEALRMKKTMRKKRKWLLARAQKPVLHQKAKTSPQAMLTKKARTEVGSKSRKRGIKKHKETLKLTRRKRKKLLTRAQKVLLLQRLLAS